MKSVVALSLLLLLQSPQQPVFRANVNFVELDVSVLDKDRRPVLDLTAADFTVLEDGVPQKVETFSAVVLPEPEPPPTSWWTSVPADVERNSDIADGALIVIIFDVQSPSLIYRVKAIARRIVERMSPRDRMAVSHLGLSGNSQDFTTDRALLLASVDKFLPSPLPGVACGPILALGDIARLMAQQPGRRKTAFYVGDNLPEPLPGTECFNAMLDVYRDAQRAHLNIYPVNPHGLQGFGDVTVESVEGMTQSIERIRRMVSAERTLAENTGGIAITQTNEFDENIERVYVENRAYYVLGYHSTNPSTDPKLREVSVTVNRPDVTVRSRSGYSVRRPAERTAAALPPMVADLDEATRAAVPATSLRLDATAVPYRGPKGPMLAVVAAAKPVIPQGGSAIQEAVQARATLIDRFGAIEETTERRIGSRLEGPDGRPAEVRVPMLLSAKPGRYQVRVAANSAASDKTGSVFVHVDVPDFNRERLSMSGVVVRVSPDAPTMALAEFEAVFPFVPSTRRTFRTTDQVEAAVRVYATRPDSNASVVCRMTDGAGQERVRLDRVAFRGELAQPAGALVRCPIDVAAAGAGHYLLEIEARLGSRTATRRVKFIIE